MILDTNALSAIVEGDPAIRPAMLATPSASIPVIALGEYRFGITQSRRQSDYARWLLENLPDYRILSIETETTESYADIRLELKQTGTRIPVNDLWIAALARQHHLPILSRDRHFDKVKGVRRISW